MANTLYFMMRLFMNTVQVYLRVEVARNHGIPFTIASDIAIIEGIDAARNILNRCWFDEVKCGLGIKALENYKKEWNDRHGCWSSQPLHNFASHGADSFRMLAVSIGKLGSKGLSAKEWNILRNHYIVNLKLKLLFK